MNTMKSSFPGVALASLSLLLGHVTALAVSPAPVVFVGDNYLITPSIVRVDSSGQSSIFATAAQLSGSPEGLAFDSLGRLLVAVNGANDILRFDVTTGSSTVFAPNSLLGGSPGAIAFDPAGNLLVAVGNQLVRLDGNGHSSQVFLGTGFLGGITFDSAGNLFVVDKGPTPSSGTIHRIDLQGHDTLFASGLWTPIGLTFDSAGNLFLGNGPGQILKFNPAGQATVFASGLNVPVGLEFDDSGNLYVAEGNDVLKFNASGQSSVVTSGISKSEWLALQAVPEPSIATLAGLCLALVFTGRRFSR